MFLVIFGPKRLIFWSFDVPLNDTFTNQKYLRCLLLECAEVVDAEVGRAAGGLCAKVVLEEEEEEWFLVLLLLPQCMALLGL